MMVAMPAGLDGDPDPIVTPQRDHVIGRVTQEIVRRRPAGMPMLVGIDGIDGSGKTTFADELSAELMKRDVPVVRSTVDSFHNPRSIRWRRGTTSPVGFYLDSHDLHALRQQLLEPFRAGAGATYRTAVFDEPTDMPVDEPARTVIGDEVLLFDGIFLCRHELVGYWDFTVFLDAQDRVNLTRLGHVMTDAPANAMDLVEHVLQWVKRMERYSAGMRYYLDRDDPRSVVDLVIDNNNLAEPTIVDSTSSRTAAS